MAKWKSDRTTIFLYVVFFLFLWDLAYFVGIRNPDRFPHPFVVFRMFGDSEFLRGFPNMLRHIIFASVLGGVIGVGIGAIILRSFRLTQAVLGFLRLGLWLPFFLLFATPDAFALSIAAVMLCSCYHYLAAQIFLGLQGREIRTYVAREAVLQALFISLLSQIWLGYWKWFEFAPLNQPATGSGVLIAVLSLLFFVNWVFRSNFDLIAGQRGIILNKDWNSASWKSFCAVLLFAVAFLIIWQMVVSLRFPRFQSSLLGVVEAGYQLLTYGEIYNDIRVSLLEIFGGMVLGACVAFLVFALVSTRGVIRNALFPVLPLLYISPIVLWLLGWLMLPTSFVHFWHKVIAVGLLTFFTFIQALWGLRKHPWPYRVLLAVDDASPIAFVAMLFGELMAATAGLGFMMTVASATYQTDKGIVGFLITLVLLVGLSTTLRLFANRLGREEATQPLPA
jgi:ABC-type nitrate/sulfonate/bicarbonate transport system permease component